MVQVMTLRRSVQRQWINDLLSGAFPQTVGFLHDDGVGYCCLGVLEDQYLRVHGLSWQSAQGTWPERPNVMATPYLPFEVASISNRALNWASGGFDTNTHVIGCDGGTAELTWLNDGLRLSFPEIAERIERGTIIIPDEGEGIAAAPFTTPQLLSPI